MQTIVCKCDICQSEMKAREPILFRNRTFDICPACAQEILYRYLELGRIDPAWESTVNNYYAEIRRAADGNGNKIADPDKTQTDILINDI